MKKLLLLFSVLCLSACSLDAPVSDREMELSRGTLSFRDAARIMARSHKPCESKFMGNDGHRYKIFMIRVDGQLLMSIIDDPECPKCFDIFD